MKLLQHYCEETMKLALETSGDTLQAWKAWEKQLMEEVLPLLSQQRKIYEMENLLPKIKQIQQHIQWLKRMNQFLHQEMIASMPTDRQEGRPAAPKPIRLHEAKSSVSFEEDEFFHGKGEMDLSKAIRYQAQTAHIFFHLRHKTFFAMGLLQDFNPSLQ